MVPLIVASLINLWVWRLVVTNILIAALALAATYALWKKSKLFSIFLALLLIFQLRTTQRAPLTYLDNDAQRVVQMRLAGYPRTITRIGHWLEERPEAIIFFRVRENIFQNLDLNYFFFGGFPRQTVGITEFEKFPYILLPFFILGIVRSVKNKLNIYYYLAFFLPLFLLGFIGNKNSLGPFSLFPFFAINIARGLSHAKN